MRVIKRYRNRKLYDMTDSCYVTLEDIAEMIRAGEELKVVDNTSGKDMTSVTLAQIILEEEKKVKESFPIDSLLELVRSGGGSILNFIESKVKPAVAEVQNIPAVQNEVRALRKKLEEIEKKLEPPRRKS